MTPPEASTFDELMADVLASATRFGHSEHLHLTWLAVRRLGVPAAAGLICEGIQRVARQAGTPQKFNTTMSRAWVELVGHHAAQQDEEDFAAFVNHNPALLDKGLLTRFYRAATLTGPLARNSWVEPDLAPFPWCAAGGVEG